VLVGVISDTHGLLRPEAVAALAGAEHILHAGDVGDARILNELRRIAPVTAIRGNVDLHGECSLLPPTEAVELDGRLFYLVHSVHDLDIDPVAAQVDVVVSGHSLNPGSAGPRRFRLPVSVALVTVSPSQLDPILVELAV
jgi:putative phosphoesterase